MKLGHLCQDTLEKVMSIDQDFHISRVLVQTDLVYSSRKFYLIAKADTHKFQSSSFNFVANEHTP